MVSCTKEQAETVNHRFAKSVFETGEVLQRVNLAPEFFGEGLTLLEQ